MNNFSQNVSTQARRWLPRLIVGALAGMLASIPMAGMMIGLNRILPRGKRSWWERWKPLPPKLITSRVSRRAIGVPITPPGRSWDASTWLAHLGYGAATASLYPVITRPLPLPDFLRGMLFALTVWATSYMGWLPANNILPPANRQSARRNAIIIGSHLLWGSLIGLSTHVLFARPFFQRITQGSTTERSGPAG